MGEQGRGDSPSTCIASCCEGWSMSHLLVMECLNSLFMKINVMI